MCVRFRVRAFDWGYGEGLLASGWWVVGSGCAPARKVSAQMRAGLKPFLCGRKRIGAADERAIR